MESGFITDQQLSAHSAWNNNRARYGAARARLYLNEWPQGWSAKKNDPSPWLQIDLLLVRTVTAVATQGYGNKNEKEWVKTYVIMTSRDGERWNAYKEGGRKRVRGGKLLEKSFVAESLLIFWVASSLSKEFLNKRLALTCFVTRQQKEIASSQRSIFLKILRFGKILSDVSSYYFGDAHFTEFIIVLSRSLYMFIYLAAEICVWSIWNAISAKCTRRTRRL